MARWQSAILLHTSAAGRRLWQLSAEGDHFAVQSEKALLTNDPLPSGVAAKDWKTLFRGKLNIAWLPPDKVFLRAIQLPASDAAEVSQMVELQMEKLSPLPVTHVVWSVYLMPRPAEKTDSLLTAIVLITARSAAEEFLGKLEEQGFLADRLEAPGLDQLLAVDMREEGVWIVPGAAGEPALVAWWYGSTVQNVTLVTLPAGPERGPQLKTQIEQIAWAGELEGWLPAPPKIHLLANPAEARFWEPIFKDAGEQINVVAPIAEAQLVARSAYRCAKDPSTNLLPPEFVTRYRQQFVDGLWMRGVFTLLGLYIIGVLMYFGALYALRLKFDHVKNELAGLNGSYTNAMKDSAQLQIYKDRQELKFAALDCLKVVAENLPESVCITRVYFDRQKFELQGTTTVDDQDDVLKFNFALQHVPNPNRADQLMFGDVAPARINIRGGNTAEWGFTCQLKDVASE
jgi:hypothetical protein